MQLANISNRRRLFHRKHECAAHARFYLALDVCDGQDGRSRSRRAPRGVAPGARGRTLPPAGARCAAPQLRTPQLAAGGGRRQLAQCRARARRRRRRRTARAEPAMEHFIETVRKYPCLWNTTAIEYRDQELKDAAWAEVMKETDLSSVKEVKLKWKKLRDSYRDALKRQSEMLAKDPVNPAKKNYPWKYMGLMQFLQPYMSNRKKPAGSPSYPAPQQTAENGHAEHSSSDSESDAESAPKRKACSQLTVIDRKLDYLCKAQSAKRACSEPGAAPAAPATPAAPAHPDPLDIFFNSMCQSTKRFPFPTQIKIKKSLFNAVIEAEEALLAEQASYASLWAAEAGSSSSSEPSDDERKPS